MQLLKKSPTHYMDSVHSKSRASTTNEKLVLQRNCGCPGNKKAKLSLRLREKPIPVLALCEGVLTGNNLLAGYVKYCCPSLPTFSHHSAAFNVAQSVPRWKCRYVLTSPW